MTGKEKLLKMIEENKFHLPKLGCPHHIGLEYERNCNLGCLECWKKALREEYKEE